MSYQALSRLGARPVAGGNAGNRRERKLLLVFSLKTLSVL